MASQAASGDAASSSSTQPSSTTSFGKPAQGHRAQKKTKGKNSINAGSSKGSMQTTQEAVLKEIGLQLRKVLQRAVLVGVMSMSRVQPVDKASNGPAPGSDSVMAQVIAGEATPSIVADHLKEVVHLSKQQHHKLLKALETPTPQVVRHQEQWLHALEAAQLSGAVEEKTMEWEHGLCYLWRGASTVSSPK